jgi:hypothetical protein
MGGIQQVHVALGLTCAAELALFLRRHDPLLAAGWLCCRSNVKNTAF